MGTPLNYIDIVKNVLQSYAAYYSTGETYTLRTVFDDEKKSYLLLDVGWQDDEYTHHVPIHIDIIDDKVWIQYDDTEEGVATDLMVAGIPNTHIVLGFRPPHLRAHTEFAVG